jgi:transcriptional regulator with XRE-family HTH domain
MALSQVLHQLSEETGLRVTEVAGLSGMRQSEVSVLFNGHNTNPKLNTLRRLALAFGLRLDEFVARLVMLEESATAPDGRRVPLEG